MPPEEEKWQVPLLRLDCLLGKINDHLSFVLEVDLFSNKANTQRPRLLILQHCKSTFYSCVASNLYSLNYHSDRLPVKSCQTQTFFTDDKSYSASALRDSAIQGDGRLSFSLPVILFELPEQGLAPLVDKQAQAHTQRWEGLHKPTHGSSTWLKDLPGSPS